MIRKKALRLTTPHVTNLLRERYSDSKWAYVEEVRNAAGFKANRSCDAIAMSVWPSNGLHLHGHEIKVSRADWRKEINDPTKAQAFAKWCHFWWIVAPRGMIQLEELPADWGLMEATEKALRIKRPATLREPETISFGFLACLLRRRESNDKVAAEIKSAEERGYRRGYEQGKDAANLDWRFQRLEKDHKRLQKHVDEFEEKSGIKLDGWYMGNVAEAVEALRRMKGIEPRILKQVASSAVTLMQQLQKLEDAG